MCRDRWCRARGAEILLDRSTISPAVIRPASRTGSPAGNGGPAPRDDRREPVRARAHARLFRDDAADEDQALALAGEHDVPRVLDRLPLTHFAGDDGIDAREQLERGRDWGRAGQQSGRRTSVFGSPMMRIPPRLPSRFLTSAATRRARPRKSRSARHRRPPEFRPPQRGREPGGERLGAAEFPVLAEPEDHQLVLVDVRVLGGVDRIGRRRWRRWIWRRRAGTAAAPWPAGEVRASLRA